MKLEIIYDDRIIAIVDAGEAVTIPSNVKFKTDITIRAISDNPDITSNFVLADEAILVTADDLIFSSKEI